MKQIYELLLLLSTSHRGQLFISVLVVGHSHFYRIHAYLTGTCEWMRCTERKLVHWPAKFGWFSHHSSSSSSGCCCYPQSYQFCSISEVWMWMRKKLNYTKTSWHMRGMVWFTVDASPLSCDILGYLHTHTCCWIYAIVFTWREKETETANKFRSEGETTTTPYSIVHQIIRK